MTNTSKLRTPLILIVDDSPLNRRMLRVLLNKFGYRTQEAEDGVEARAKAGQYQPDLILLDVMMPQEDGFDTCIKLKKEAITQDIPIIFISALNDTENIVKGLEVGGVDYISKPFAQTEVLARIRVHLELKFAKERLIEAQVQRFADLKQAQESFLVESEKLPEANFSYIYQPILEAGGDFLDVVQTGEKSHVYVVADVSGHDLGTAYMTSALKVLIDQNINPYTPMQESLKMINAVLNRILQPTQHLTANFLKVDRERRKLRLYNAGHPPPVMIPRDNSAALILDAEGDILGPFEQVEFSPLERDIQSGDRVYLFTDGLVEAFGENYMSRQEGMDKLLKACQDASSYPLQQALQYIFSKLRPENAFSEDDAVLLVTEI
ncbi:SpoIIE family protein phosphatase [Desulfonatronospira sp.]|uniref:SpoIIE family protein phosphatase n=1 Tax=Desulfonatronospira sp. TaxID=1962951 RepID=UPI0025B80142|nr:SpoIIE family protein phosphatase [Desulfonatronospira sp.]